MLDLLYGITGIAFAWLVLGAVLLPAAMLLEWMIEEYVKYSTKGDIKIPLPFRNFFNKWIVAEEGNSWLEEKNLEALYMIPVIFAIIVGTFITCMLVGIHDYEWSEAFVQVFFTTPAIVGTWLAPVLLFVVVAIAPSLLSRKLFDLKQRFFAHVDDKDAHKAGEKA